MSVVYSLSLLILCLIPFPCIAQDRIAITGLTSLHVGQRVPDGWKSLDFPAIENKTFYEITHDKRYGAAIHARSSAGAGGLVRPLSVSAEDYPDLHWSWKIEKTIIGSMAGSKKGDDFPVRLMVSFKKHPDRPSSTRDNVLCYVWGDTDAVGTFAENPFHRQVITIVVANTDDPTGQWVEFSRNVVADYMAAFGGVPGWISAITVMTDSDNTRSDTQAWYGPIVLSGQ